MPDEAAGKVRVEVEADQQSFMQSVGGLGSKVAGIFGPIGALAAETFGPAFKAVFAGDEAKAVDSASSLGKKAGSGFGLGATTALAAVGVGAALYKVGSDFSDAYHTIQKTTGASGTQLKGLEDSFKNVAKQSGASFGNISTTLASFAQRTGATGKPLEDMTLSVLRLSKVTGTDLSGDITSVSKLMQSWGIPTQDATKLMDQLYVTSSKTGVGVNELADQVTRYGPQLRAMGFSVSDAEAMLGSFGKEGVNTAAVMTGMNKAAGTLAKQGVKDIPGAFNAAISSIKGTKDASKATADAIALFGAKAGPQLADAIRSGKLNFEDLSKAIAGSGGKLKDVATQTKDWPTVFATFRNQIKVALEPVATTVFDSVNNAIKDLAPTLATAATDLSKLITFVAQNKDVFVPLAAGIAAVAGAILAVNAAIKVGQAAISAYKGVVSAVKAVQVAWNVVMTAFNAILLVNPVILIVVAVIALIGVLVLLYAKWKPFRDAVNEIGHLASVGFKAFLDAIKAVFNWVKANWVLILGILLGPIATAAALIYKNWDTIKKAFSAAFDAIKSAGADFVNFFVTLPGKILDALKTLPGLLGDLFKLAIQGVVLIIAIQILAVYKFFFDIVPTILGYLVNLGTSLATTFASAIAAIPGVLTTAAVAVWSWFASVVPRVVAFLIGLPGQLATIARNAVVSFYNQIVAQAVAVWSFFSQLIPRVVTYLASLPSRLAAIGSNALHSFYSGVTAAAAAVWSFFSQVVPRAASYLAGLPGRLYNLGVEAINSMIHGITAAAGGLWSWLSGLGSRIWTTLIGLPNELLTMGKAMIEGLINGIGSMAGAVASKIKSVVTAPISAAKSILGMHSPSTVFAEMGRNTVLGYIQGINQTAGQVQPAVANAIPTTVNVGATGGGGASTGAGGPAVVIQNATFTDEADIETFMKKAAWVVQTQRI